MWPGRAALLKFWRTELWASLRFFEGRRLFCCLVKVPIYALYPALALAASGFSWLEPLRLGASEFVLCGLTVAALFFSCRCDAETPTGLLWTPYRLRMG